MRATTLMRKTLGVTGLIVDDFEFTEDGLVVAVRPRWQKPRCGGCGKRAAGYDHRPVRRWRHLGIGRLKIWLEYAPRRVRCPRCDGIVTEKVPWAPHQSRFTWDFEELTAYLAQGSDKTKVTKLMASIRGSGLADGGRDRGARRRAPSRPGPAQQPAPDRSR